MEICVKFSLEWYNRIVTFYISSYKVQSFWCRKWYRTQGLRFIVKMWNLSSFKTQLNRILRKEKDGAEVVADDMIIILHYL